MSPGRHVCCYCVWTYWHLHEATRIFGELFDSLNIELPMPTRFVLANHAWLYPLLFVGAGTLVVGKEFFMRDKKLSLAGTFMIAFAVLTIADGFVRVIYAPLFTLVDKLGR